jgi:hypothetical protein
MIRIIADKIKIYGAKIDGSYTISFDVGEYQQTKIAELLLIKQNTNIILDISTEAKNEPGYKEETQA